MAIDGINIENWRAKPLKEIVQNIDIVEEEDSEVAKWAQAMSAVANAPDNVTYDMAGGSIEEFTAELDKITKEGLPIEGEEPPEEEPPEDVEGIEGTEEIPEEEEEKEIGIKDELEEDEETKAEAASTIEDPNAPPKEVPESETAQEEEQKVEEVNPDEGINTEDEAIRKRKIKKGETTNQ